MMDSDDPRQPSNTSGSSSTSAPSDDTGYSASGDGESRASERPSPGTSGPMGPEDVADETNPIEREMVADTTSKERAEAARENADPTAGDVDLDFGADDLPDRLRRASDEAMHAASFGIIRLDDDGQVTFYNRFEQTLSTMSGDEVLGRNFFEEVAPCTYAERFSGTFFEGVRSGDLDTRFVYTFSYRMEPLMVKIRLCRDPAGDNYVLVKPME